MMLGEFDFTDNFRIEAVAENGDSNGSTQVWLMTMSNDSLLISHFITYYLVLSNNE